jgi:CheY-like chemotaxis protein
MAPKRPAARTRVLVVEDNDDARESLCLFLSLSGFEVREAADGPDGLAQALEWRPDVVISDIGLPRLDGWALAEQVRSRLGAAVFLVALTGYATMSDRRRSLDAGFDAHLAKPADPEVLLGLLAGRTGERRGHPRRRVARPRAAALLSARGRVAGGVAPEEVSAGGLSMLASEALAVGDVLALSPEAPHPLAGRQYPFRVSRCEPLRFTFRIAGAFVSPLSDAELDALAEG